MILHQEPASVAQRMLWLLGRQGTADGRLNYPLLLRFRGRLDITRLRYALDRLVERHEALRTTFGRRGGLLTQLVHAPERVPLVVTPVGDLNACLTSEVATPIDVTIAPVRATLWAVQPDEHVLCFNAHHLVTDAWSCRLLTRELLALLAGETDLPRVRWQYRHVTQWQRRRATMASLRRDEEFWATRFGASSSDASVMRATGAPETPLRVDLTSDVHELARQHRTSLFPVLLAALNGALRDETGRPEVGVVAPFANRVRPEMEGTVGLFAGLVRLRTPVGPEDTFADLVRGATRTVAEAMAHQHFPYHLLPVAEPEPVLQLLPHLPEPTRLPGLVVEVLPPEIPNRFPLELAVVPGPRGLRIVGQCSPPMSRDSASRLLAGFQGYLKPVHA